jgi:proline dehydrogenase
MIMDLGTKIFRSALLAIAGNKAAGAFALKYGLRLGANKFVAGETLEDALAKIQDLNSKGIVATLDHLGEGITRIEEAVDFREEYLRLLDGIDSSGVDSNVSLKPTQMGLALDAEACYNNIREIVVKAKQLNNFVRIDMEDTPYTDATINIMKKLHSEGLTNVGTVIQAYLYRTEEDISQLTDEGYNLRLVKGAYKEPAELAYPQLRDVDENFKRIIEARLSKRIYTGVATHDDKIIEWTKSFVKEKNIPLDVFEFQMLYGVRMQLQEDLVQEGYKVRCYVPYGRMWYPYFVRRLAERPANLAFVVKNMIKG